jgi:hypothetical protein
MSPSTGTSFPLFTKLLLVLASIAAYLLVANIAEALDPLEAVPDAGLWFHYVVGALFGALVLGPYAAADHRPLRILGLAAASAVIYRLAILFVTEGPLDYGVLATFVITGAGAALLCALAVWLVAPQPFRPLAFVLALVAGALGGATFELKVASDPFLLVSHAAWQLLVCLALHAGFGVRRA